MLYQVFMTRAFADDAARIGVLEAASLQDAVNCLKAWWEQETVGSEHESLGGADITVAQDFAQVSYTSRCEGIVDVDTYYLRPVAGPFLFHAEDWRIVFS